MTDITDNYSCAIARTAKRFLFFHLLYNFDPSGYNNLLKVIPVSLIFYYLIISVLYGYLDYNYDVRYSWHKPKHDAHIIRCSGYLMKIKLDINII